MERLVLVARRVKLCIESLRYQTLLVCRPGAESYSSANPRHTWTPDALNTLAKLNPAVLREHGRHVAFVACGNDTVTKVLSQCGAINNLMLFFVGNPTHLPRLKALPLRRLSVMLQLLFPTERNFTHPLFANLTHLDIWTPTTDHNWEHWSGLALIPRLSHLSFHDSDNITNTLCQRALNHCKLLEVLVIIALESHIDRADTADHDARLVIYVSDFLGDWAKGAEGGVDYWERAEVWVDIRNSDEMESYVYDPEIVVQRWEMMVTMREFFLRTRTLSNI
ncbi:hypothetical protein DFH06DRAFT_1320679 [Mycena polygramma]|nr:hypothetical protein DFH06DRAFT_1320679 [Mycena polygramma]